jgi:acetyltransferase-like isoleucine patch superfamily enzyme
VGEAGGATVSSIVHRVRKLALRYLTALGMVAPTMQARIRFNRWKGVRFGRDPWLGVLVYLDIHHSHPDRANSLIIGDGVAIGNNVSIYTHDSLYHLVTDGNEPVNFGRVVIGDHVNVSPHAFLYDCTIGSHSIVAPGAVVAGGEYPPYSLIAGNPAKVVKDIRSRVERSMGATTS